MVGGSYKVAPDDAQFLRLLKGVLPQLSAQLNSSHLFRLGTVLNVARSGSTYMTYWASFELIKTDCLIDHAEKGDKKKDCNDWDEEGRKLVCKARVNKPCCIQNDYPPSADQLECTVSLL
ncbi:hypothetical protein TYRP_003662 [Tyrophagus putrescentiae]|nr:hypothetical protein TYRP_003662 [Tyrophagus putrescentiae]